MNNENSSRIYNDFTEPPKPVKPRVAGALSTAAAIVIVLAGIKAASGLLSPIMLALFLAIVLLIPLRFLQRNRCPAFLSYLLVIGGTIALFVALTYFVGRSLNEFIGKIPAYRDRFEEKYSQIESKLESLGFAIGGKTEDKPVAVNGKTPVKENTPPAINSSSASVSENTDKNTKTQIEDKTDTAAKDAAAQLKDEAENSTAETNPTLLPLLKPSMPEDVPTVNPEEVEQWVKNVHDKSPSLIALDPQNVSYWIANVFLQLRHFIESSFLVLIFTVFMLFEASQFSAKVERAIGKDAAINNEHLHQIAQDIRHYLVLKTIVNCASGSAAMFIYWMFGVPAWFFWGIIAFFLYYIPNIGGTLAAVIPGILIFINYDVPGVLLYAVCLVALECTIAYGFEPRFLGHGLGLSTVVILLTLVFWGWLLGPIGLFLAAPLTVMVKIILQAFPETKWIAIMLDDRRWKSAK